jgi:uncharacterized protein involved in type VI secretion and phage assembly
VIGACWNKEDKPPEINSDGKNNIRKIKSRSGHEIIFNDDHEKGQEQFQIHTKAGHSILLDDSTGREKIEIKDKTGSNVISIDSVTNTITIQSAATLKLKAAMIEIEAQTTLSIKAGAMMTIQGALVKIN